MSQPPADFQQKRRSKNVTLKDVASAAGVTAMTVSKVLKGNGHISAATRERVLRVVEEMNYTVNPAARSLVTGRTGIIAVVCGSLDQMYYARLVSLLEVHLNHSGYQMRLLHRENELIDLVNATKTSAVDGVIVSGAHDLSEKPEFMSSHIANRCVFLDTFEHPNTDYVRIDVRDAITQSLEAMITAGCKRIAYVGLTDGTTFDPSWAVEARLKTYLSVMQQAGRVYEFINSRPIAKAEPLERVRSICDYLEINGCPDGLLCLHGEIALLTHRALNQCGYRVPEDVLLIGGDDVPPMTYSVPSISAISHPLQDACATAWQFLHTRIVTPDTPLQQVTLKADFIARESMPLQNYTL